MAATSARKKCLPVLAALSVLFLGPGPLSQGKEYLTPDEIVKIQDAQQIDERTKLYLEFAASRLKTAGDRLNGMESSPGDPLEFFSVEDMADGYYQILRSVMLNLDAAASRPGTERPRLAKALKDLKSSTEKALRELELLKREAEEKRKEDLWNLVNRAIDITKGAHDGAEEALAHEPTPPSSKGRKLERK